MVRTEQQVINDFWAKVQKSDGCWEWDRCTVRGGYGVFYWNNQHHLAHRFSLQIAGVDVPKGKHVLHLCDNPRCVRPDHLKVGSHTENMIDRGLKLGQAHGERHGMAKLTETEVRQIVELVAAGELTQQQVADRYGVTQAMVNNIWTGKAWKHLGLGTTVEGVATGHGDARKSLTDDDVRQIKSLIAAGWSDTQLAERFGVSRTNILSIRSGRTWGQVPEQSPADESPPRVVNEKRKLTEDEVIQIRRRCAAGERATVIAPDYGVSSQNVLDIKNGKTWKHVV